VRGSHGDAVGGLTPTGAKVADVDGYGSSDDADTWPGAGTVPCNGVAVETHARSVSADCAEELVVRRCMVGCVRFMCSRNSFSGPVSFCFLALFSINIRYRRALRGEQHFKGCS
jgi:hypothetical protein